MSISVSSPVTGAAQTGFTSPTYTVVQDQDPAPNGKQWVVTALGGTQAGVVISSASNPFFVSLFRPLTFKPVGVPDASGILRTRNVNTWKFHVWKGVTPYSGQAPQVMKIRGEIDVPAGADTADAANIRAALALMIGTLSQVSASLGDSIINGTL